MTVTKGLAVITLRIRLTVRDYDLWRDAFGRDAAGRAAQGATAYRIFRLPDDHTRIELDIDFPDQAKADTFLAVMRNDVWPSPDKAPAKLGTPQTSFLDYVEHHAY